MSSRSANPDESSYVYVITNNQNGKIYCGKANGPEDRWKSHLQDLKRDKHSNKVLYRAIRKHGIECFDFVVVQEYESEKAALEGEIEWIAALDSTTDGWGYNQTKGGEGCRPTADTKRRTELGKAKARLLSTKAANTLAKATELYSQGHTQMQISKSMGLDYGYVREILAKAGIHTPKKFWCRDRDDEILNLHHAGMSQRKIAGSLGCNRGTVVAALQRAGLVAKWKRKKESNK